MVFRRDCTYTKSEHTFLVEVVEDGQYYLADGRVVGLARQVSEQRFGLVVGVDRLQAALAVDQEHGARLVRVRGRHGVGLLRVAVAGRATRLPELDADVVTVKATHVQVGRGQVILGPAVNEKVAVQVSVQVVVCLQVLLQVVL